MCRTIHKILLQIDVPFPHSWWDFASFANLARIAIRNAGQTRMRTTVTAVYSRTVCGEKLDKSEQELTAKIPSAAYTSEITFRQEVGEIHSRGSRAVSTTFFPMSVISTGAASINHAIADYLYQLRTSMNKMERVIGKIAKIDNSHCAQDQQNDLKDGHQSSGSTELRLPRLSQSVLISSVELASTPAQTKANSLRMAYSSLHGTM